ncbi:hypothetical protein GCM10009739_11160 [Microbacterium ulmi]
MRCEGVAMRIPDARRVLLTRAELSVRGLTDRAIESAVRERRLRRVDYACYVDQSDWNSAYAEGRHLLRVVAADERQRGGDVIASHASAAVVHELPLFRLAPKRVHLSGTHVDGRVKRAEPLVAHHRITVAETDIVEIDGIRCTSLARTVADTIRGASRMTSVALADAALRRVAMDAETRGYDEAKDAAFREEVAARLQRGARGVRQARWVLEFADGRAESPGESGSRLLLWELGFAGPRLQVPVPSPSGGHYEIDFGLDDVDAWGEYDGQGKYRDPNLREDASLEDVLLAEKSREDWIRGTTGRRFARWGREHIETADTLGARLAAFHIRAR